MTATTTTRKTTTSRTRKAPTKNAPKVDPAPAPAPVAEAPARKPKSFQASARVAAWLLENNTAFAAELETKRADGWPTMRLDAEQIAKFTAEVEKMLANGGRLDVVAAEAQLKRITAVA